MKKITDNTAKDVEIEILLAPGISPEVTMDALYAFTSCEVSISPNACVIVDNKPIFTNVNDILKISTLNTKKLLGKELEIKKSELEEKWHMASLEKIFIEKRIYRDIEECEDFESVIKAIDLGLKKYLRTPSEKLVAGDTRLKLHREIIEDDIIKLTEIKIKKISKYNSFKNTELIQNIEEELEKVIFDLAHLTEFTIKYFEMLLEKYGNGKERKTEITSLEEIKAKQVIINNTKLYINSAEGFIGMNIKDGEFVADCSDIDDIIVFKKDGTFQVVRIGEKVFVGKDIIHVGIWRKNDNRTTYNLIYVDGKSLRTMAKRFQVSAITREKDYNLTAGNPNSKLLYFSANPNGEAELMHVQLTPGSKARKKNFDFDFGELGIKGRSANGNIVTKYPVRKISLLKKGKSSLGSIKVWMDEVSGRINMEERGQYLGSFDTGDLIIAIYKNGTYVQKELNKSLKFEVNQLSAIGKCTKDTIISCLYFEGEKGWSMVKRFQIETSTLDESFGFLSDHNDTKLYFASIQENPVIEYKYRADKQVHSKELDLSQFIDVKGWKALGNKLGEFKLMKVMPVVTETEASNETPEEASEEKEDSTSKPSGSESSEDQNKPKEPKNKKGDKPSDYTVGDTIEFDF